MPLLICQNCGNHQNDGSVCRKCSMPLFGHPSAAGSGTEKRLTLPPVDSKRGRSTFRMVYRIANYATIVLLIVVVVLILHKPQPPQVTADPQAAQRAESKIQASESASSSGQPEPLHLDSSEVNSLLHQDLKLDPQAAGTAPGAAADQQASPTPSATAPDPTIEQVQSSVKDVKVTMHDDRVEAYVVFNFHGEDLSLDLEGKLGVNDGVLQFQPTQGTLGSLPIPQSALDDAVQKMLSSPENRDKLKLPADIRNLRVENGELVVDYK